MGRGASDQGAVTAEPRSAGLRNQPGAVRLPVSRLQSLHGHGRSPNDRAEANHFDAYRPFEERQHPATRPRALASIMDGWTHQPTGITASVTRDDRLIDFRSVFVELRTRDGEFVGDVGRQFHFDAAGRLVAGYGTVKLDEAFRRQGIVRAVNEHCVREYRRLGVDRIELNAVGDGAWVWANWPGMHFEPRGDQLRGATYPNDVCRQAALDAREMAFGSISDESARELLDRYVSAGRVSADLARHTLRVLPSPERIADGDMAGALLLPQQVADLGRDQPWDGTWLGRELIREHGRRRWSGVLFVS
jgi:hypothetical protein